MPPFIKVLQNRNFRSLWLAQIISQIGSNMLLFVLAIRVYENTVSNTAVSILILCMAVPAIIFGVLAGTLVGQWEKKRVLIAANLLRMLLVIGFFISSETMIWVYLLIIAVSIITQFFVPAEGPMIPLIVPQNLLLTANSLFTITFYSSLVLGFVLAGPALKIFGPHNAFLMLSLFFALAALFVSQIDFAEKNEKRRVGKGELFLVWHDFWYGIKSVVKQKQILEPILFLTGSQALISSLSALAPGFAFSQLKIDVQDASLVIMGPAALGMVLGSALIGNWGKKFKAPKLINLGIFSAGVFLLFLSGIGRFTHLSFVMICLFLLGTANALISVPANTLLQEKSPENLRSRVYGILTSLTGGAGIMPTVFVGIMADLFGVGKIIFAMAVIIILYGIYRMMGKKI